MADSDVTIYMQSFLYTGTTIAAITDYGLQRSHKYRLT